MAATTISTGMLNEDAIAAQEMEEDEQNRQKMEQEALNQEIQVDEEVRRQMANISVILEESDSDNEQHEHQESLTSDPRTPALNLKTPAAKFLTSTPFNPHLFDIEAGPLTPEQEQDQRYLKAKTSQDRLEVLYEARGHELERLRNEMQNLQDENENENRALKHDVAILTADNEQLKSKFEQLQLLYQESLDDNQSLRSEIDHMKNAMHKVEKSKEELIARCESSDHLVQSLQSQLIEFQSKDTVLKAREHHDALVSSLKERHESEMSSFQNEVDGLAAKVKRYEHELEQMRSKMNDSQRYHESLLMEKSDKIQELNRRLFESQKRLNELIVSNSTNQDLESRIGNPVQEICKLKTALTSITQQRNEQERVILDLNDQLAELQSKMNEASTKISAEAQNEIHELRQLNSKWKTESEELKNRERELENRNEDLKSQLANLQDQIRATSNVENQNRFALDEVNFRLIQTLKKELKEKDEELSQQQDKISQYINEWEENAQQIKANHGKDRRALDEMQTKYKDLKRKVRAYQKHRQKEREHYINENQELRDWFTATFLEYKEKMENACEKRDKQVENELMALKHQFDTELRKFHDYQNQRTMDQDDPPSLAISSPSRTDPVIVHSAGAIPKDSRISPDEENQRPTSSRAEEMAKIFAQVTRDARLKMPPSTSDGRTPLLECLNTNK